MIDDHLCIVSEIVEVEALLESIPEGNLIERKSLEDRLEYLKRILAAMRRREWKVREAADLVVSHQIGEQQKEIARLRLMEKNNLEAWQRETKAVERLASAAFSVLNHPERPEGYFELRQAVIAMGFCPRCECRPCECDDDSAEI
jgi:hypothetical protein